MPDIIEAPPPVRAVPFARRDEKLHTLARSVQDLFQWMRMVGGPLPGLRREILAVNLALLAAEYTPIFPTPEDWQYFSDHIRRIDEARPANDA